ncbi:MAG: hypothetical protein P4L51_10650 [Puia sp.]|nr:hypothetical protein [Puia sp.]
MSSYTYIHERGCGTRFRVLDLLSGRKGVLIRIAGELSISDAYSIIMGDTIYFFPQSIAVKIPPRPVKVAATLRLSNMLVTRLNLGLARWRLQYIYAVGGIYAGRPTSICERYSVAQNDWTWVPRLNSPQSNNEACIVNDRVLYTIGVDPSSGIRLLNYGCRRPSSVERLDLQDEENGWMILTVAGLEWILTESCRACQRSDSEVLVFGCMGERSYTFGVTVEGGPMNVTPAENMKCEEDFSYSENVTVTRGGNINVMSSVSGRLHTYSIKKKVWTMRKVHYNE